jgi:site-specific DNA-methyltransferase (adenine-specific)
MSGQERASLFSARVVEDLVTPYYQDDAVTIYHGDARGILPLLTDSVDLVLTDPPYPSEFLNLYGVLGRESARLLRPGGSLVTLCGTHQLPDVLDLIRPSLRYWWTGSMLHTSKLRLPGKWVTSCWKPAPWFVREYRRDDVDVPVDALLVRAADKRFHEWGQPVDWFSHWITRLTLTSESVLDPFMGAGTTLVAAKLSQRRSIGIEIEERYCHIAADRCSQGVFDFGEMVS